MVTRDPYRIVFFGTPAFAVPSLNALLRSRHTVVGAVTQPDRPRGRGQKITDAPVKVRVAEAGIPILQPERLKDPGFLDALASLRADIGVVAAYGKILNDAVLATPRLGLVNVHASILPRYRGAAPVHRAVIAGESETGVTIMRVVKALDAGPMLAVARRPIGAEETSDEVEHDLATLGAALLIDTLEALADDRVREEPQDESAATYAHRLTKDDGIIDWTQSAVRVHNLIRGLHPWPHAAAFVNDRRYILHRSSIAIGLYPAGQPGTIIEAHGDLLIVATGDAPLRIVSIQAEGKRPMASREFLAGHPLRPGDRFTAAPATA